MPVNRLGYACINETLKAQRPRVCANRGMIKRTFHEKGSGYAAELILQNARDQLAILEWNEQHNIRFFRMSSDMLPWASEFNLLAEPLWPDIEAALAAVGDFARQHDHRITMHPGPFNCLGSPNESVIANTIKDMELHGLLLDAINAPRSPHAKINIHVGGAYGEHEDTMDRFCRNVERLSESVRSRLTVENDDRPNLFSISQLYRGIWQRTEIPIVFDSLHYEYGPADCPKSDALDLAVSTWPDGVVPVCHHSSSRKLHEDATCRMAKAHADYIYEPFECGAHTVDVMLETKAKEAALLQYRKQFCGPS